MRIPALDALRAVAILLVFGRHAHWPDGCQAYFGWLQRGGWVGVDLFFVLSGFLVSGLLFADHQRSGTIHWARFYVRRGFKIYPSFWCLIAFTIYVAAVTGMKGVTFESVLNELLFVQNYTPNRLWGHTWSLAIEEHFYLLLPPLLIWLPFKRLPRIVLMVAIGLLTARCLTAWGHTHYSDLAQMQPTHLRLDSLLFGVLLSYWYHYDSRFKPFCSRYAGWLYVVGAALLAPAFIWPLDAIGIHTFGFTAFYLGAGAILSAAVCRGLPDTRCTQVLAAIGLYSYSIYLWHVAIFEWMCPTLIPQYTWLDLICGPVLSVGFGILWARAIELPCLRLRDWLTARSPLRVTSPRGNITPRPT